MSNKYPALGERVDMSVGRDQAGQWWWKRHDQPEVMHGPFRSSAEADEDFRVTVFGPQCKVKSGGRWDPAGTRSNRSHDGRAFAFVRRGCV